MVFDATLSYIVAVSFMVEETTVHGESHQPATSHQLYILKASSIKLLHVSFLPYEDYDSLITPFLKELFPPFEQEYFIKIIWEWRGGYLFLCQK